MPLQLPPLPSFQTNIPQPANPIDQMVKLATLRGMLGENQLRSQLAPLQVQQQQQQTQQAGLETQKQQMQIDSQRNMMKMIAGGDLNKFAGSDGAAPDNGGFDAGGAYQYMISNGILPEHASQLVNGFQTVAKNSSEIRKNQGEAASSYLKNRATSHEQMADDIAEILNLPPGQQAAGLALKQGEYLKKPLPGVDQADLALFNQADVSHLPALAGVLDLHGKIEEYNAGQTKAAGEKASAEQKIRSAAAPTLAQLTNAVTTVSTYNAIPPNMRSSLSNEMKAAPDWSTLQEVQKRADAANESFQRSADARQQAMALKDVGMQNLVAGKLVTEDQKLGSALDQTSGIRGLLDMSKGGNQAATSAALTRFAEHEIVEGGVKRMNQTEYENLAGSLGSYGRKFQSWVDGGFKGEMPAATNANIQAILNAEDTAANAAHERNVGFITNRYAKPGAQPSAAAPTSGNAAPSSAATSTGLPRGNGRVIDKGTAMKFYQAAGNDPDKARQLASQSGWKVQ